MNDLSALEQAFSQDREVLDDRSKNHEPMMRLITFFLDNECYGVEVERVREILRINQIFPVPGAMDCVTGITNIRGNVVTIIDGRRRMNLQETTYTDDARMIVVESDDVLAAIVVDSVSDVIDVPKSKVAARPKMNSPEDSPFVEGVVSDDNNLIILLNIERLITEDAAMAIGF